MSVSTSSDESSWWWVCGMGRRRPARASRAATPPNAPRPPGLRAGRAAPSNSGVPQTPVPEEQARAFLSAEHEHGQEEEGHGHRHGQRHEVRQVVDGQAVLGPVERVVVRHRLRVPGGPPLGVVARLLGVDLEHGPRADRHVLAEARRRQERQLLVADRALVAAERAAHGRHEQALREARDHQRGGAVPVVGVLEAAPDALVAQRGDAGAEREDRGDAPVAVRAAFLPIHPAAGRAARERAGDDQTVVGQVREAGADAGQLPVGARRPRAVVGQASAAGEHAEVRDAGDVRLHGHADRGGVPRARFGHPGAETRRRLVPDRRRGRRRRRRRRRRHVRAAPGRGGVGGDDPGDRPLVVAVAEGAHDALPRRPVGPGQRRVHRRRGPEIPAGEGADARAGGAHQSTQQQPAAGRHLRRA
ncbi:t121.2 [Tupaiid betaherpesvirus 1]|uniref:T121.2 n=1 Tax=Tupaiid herpesvirus 1 (strain 1) TaxID=10397 RepID=Q91TH8_TUHV1|nr:t121.2 [Tupaiid betaherpesvirus 1]AAK57169.1 t121.2 [Tupaiid betaherpesvirus 1]